MKTIIGSAIGVLAVGLVLIGFGLRGAATSNAPAFVAPQSIASGNSNVLPVSDVSGATAGGPVMVNCAPGQRALVRQVAINGQAVSQVACVADQATALASDGYAAVGSQAVRPVSYQGARASDLTERRVVYQQPTTPRTTREQRSWKKPLLVIGGSTAAGAGIGGIIGGKKGALIGAALGGGASTLYEATRK